MKCSLGISNFLKEISSLSHYCFPLFLCIVHLQRLSYLSLLFSGTLHSDGYIFPFLFCLSFLFFSQLFVRPPQTAVLPCCISVWGDGFGLHLQYNVTNLCSLFFCTLSVRSNPLNLFVSFTVKSQGIWFSSYLNGLVGFPTFFNLSLNFAITCLWSEQQPAPGLVVADCIELFHIWLQRM